MFTFHRLVRGIALVLTLAWAVQALEPAHAAPQGSAFEIGPLIGVPSNDARSLDLLGDLIQRSGGSLQHKYSADELTALASRVGEGFVPGSLLDAAYEIYPLSKTIAVSQKFSRPFVRRQLYDQILALASKEQESDARGAAILLRAYLVLVSDDFSAVPSADLVKLIRDKKSLKLIGVDEHSTKALATAADELESAAQSMFAFVMLSAPMLAGMLQPEGAIDPSLRTKLLTELREASARSQIDLRAQRTYATTLWTFYRLASSRRDIPSCKAVEAEVEHLAAAATNAHASRWFREVLTTPGGAPKNSGTKIVKGPNDLKPVSP